MKGSEGRVDHANRTRSCRKVGNAWRLVDGMLVGMVDSSCISSLERRVSDAGMAVSRGPCAVLRCRTRGRLL
jgi:hypothetical protein